MIFLTKTIVRNIEYINRIPDNTTVNLETTINYDANYNDKDKKCLGKLSLTIGDKDEDDKFFISVEMHGMFDVKEEDYTPDDVTKETYNILYPQLQAYVSAVTALSGVPALPLPSLPLIQEKE